MCPFNFQIVKSKCKPPKVTFCGSRWQAGVAHKSSDAGEARDRFFHHVLTLDFSPPFPDTIHFCFSGTYSVLCEMFFGQQQKNTASALEMAGEGERSFGIEALGLVRNLRVLSVSYLDSTMGRESPRPNLRVLTAPWGLHWSL